MVLHKTRLARLEGNPKQILFVLCNFLTQCSPKAIRACQNLQKGVRFQFRKTKVANTGVLHKTRLEGDLKIFTLGVTQLFDTTLPRGPIASSKARKRGLGIWGSCIKQNLKVTQKHLRLVLCNFLIWHSLEDLQTRQYTFGGLDKWAPF